MSIEIRDFGNALDYRDTVSGDRKTFSKQAVQIGLENSGSNVGIFLADSRTAVSFSFADVTLPVQPDIETLYFELQKWVRRVDAGYGYVKYFRSAANINPLGSTPENFIVVDLSNTATYPHTYTDHLEIQTITITAREAKIPVPGTANIAFKLGYLQDVDAIDGDLYTIHTEAFSLAASELISKQYNFGSNAIVLDNAKYLTADKSLSDVAWKNTATLRSTADPTSTNVNPGTGDLVGVITFWDAGTAEISIEIGYNSF